MTELIRYKSIKDNYTKLVAMDTADIVQSGGGAWSTYSSGNDSTHDMLYEFKIMEITLLRGIVNPI